jgi:hypothetical protein
MPVDPGTKGSNMEKPYMAKLVEQQCELIDKYQQRLLKGEYIESNQPREESLMLASMIDKLITLWNRE